MIALMVMAPALTVLCDLMAALGGWVVATQIIGVASQTYINSAKEALTYNDIVGGVVKPFTYGFIIAIVGCRFGLRTVGGTVGVGRSTTQSVVMASILIISTEFFLSKLFIALGDLGFLK
jgi:phospholipid/cholesterol/gamma-HCH transport system permease protein